MELTIPGDKSISHRAVLFGAIAQGETVIDNFLEAGDTRHTLAALERLGVRARREPGRVIIAGAGVDGLRAPAEPLYVGNSGTSARLLLGLLAGRPFASTLDGDVSLRRRPMQRVTQPLGLMGAHFAGADGASKLPLTVTGGSLQAIRYDLPIASAQVKSALLLAGLQAGGRTSLKEPGLSRDHTERMLRYFGGPLAERDGRLEISSGPLTARPLTVPADISSAAFFLVGTAISPGREVTIRNLGLNPTRTGLLDALTAMGAGLKIRNRRQAGGEEVGDLTLRGGPLYGTTIVPDQVPRLIDELPILALAAACAEGTTRVTGAAELRVKESDRIAMITREFARLGVTVVEFPDGFEITGPQRFRGGAGECGYDHRIAMTLLLANTVSDGEITVANSDEYIETSFPGFRELYAAWRRGGAR